MTKKNMIQKSDNEIGKFWKRKKSTYRRTGPNSSPAHGKLHTTSKHTNTKKNAL